MTGWMNGGDKSWSIGSVPVHALLYVKTHSIPRVESFGISDWREQSKAGLGEKGISGSV